ncbi:hypothetical protein RP20_CCG019057 [Aedes albopictus]|nr:hypothetical protein RP20_CCG019057 [Aedes albopictus]
MFQVFTPISFASNDLGEGQPIECWWTINLSHRRKLQKRKPLLAPNKGPLSRSNDEKRKRAREDDAGGLIEALHWLMKDYDVKL